jgi:putative ABC transport system permease protein
MNPIREISEGLKISASAIFSNKLRSGLTTLGIVIGILTVSLMAMALEGMRQKFLRSISALGADVFYIEKYPWERTTAWWRVRNRRDFSIQDAKIIQRESIHALAVSVENSAMLPVRYRDRSSTGVWICGNNEQSALVRQLVVKEGRFFSEAEVAGARPVCVLGAEIAEKLFPDGRAVGERIQVAGKSFEVIGVNEKFGAFIFANMDNQVIIPITRLTSDFMRDPYVFFMVKIRPESKMDEAREELRGIVRKIRRVPPDAEDDFAINQQEMMIKQFDKVVRTLGAIGMFITGLALFVGGIGIMNIMFVSVAERTKEIGIRKAIGAKRRTILIQFLIEAIIIGLFGGTIGLAAAWGANAALQRYLPTGMSLQVAALALAMSLVTAIVAGFFPANRAARMNAVDALRAE